MGEALSLMDLFSESRHLFCFLFGSVSEYACEYLYSYLIWARTN